MNRWIVSSCRFGILTSLCLTLTVAADARTWTAEDGRQIEAEYVSAADGKVQLRSAKDGKTYTIPISALSAEDRLLIGDDIFSRKIRENPKDPNAYLRRGMARLNRDDYDSALTDLNQTIQLDSKNAEAHDGRGQVYAEMGDPIKAHSEFDKAIKLDPQLASAYRHRGDNYKALAKAEGGDTIVDQKVESYRKSYQAARQEQLRDKGWQPLNSTTGNITRYGAVAALAKTDYEFADRIERGYKIGGGGIGGGGIGYGKGYGVGGGPGGGVVKAYPGKGIPGEADPALAVYPEKAQQGETITIVANPSELAKGMAAAQAESGKGKPKSAYDKDQAPPKIEKVDFYRDVNGNGQLDSSEDQYLASDSDGTDGYSVTVSTEKFPPGNQTYFAEPKGGPENPLTPEQMTSLAESLEEAAAKEKAIAQKSGQAGESSGLSSEQAEGLGGDQKSVSDVCEDCLDKLKQAAPEAAELVSEASKPMKAIGNLMKAASTKPGEESKAKASDAASRANDAAEKLAEAAAKLREMAESDEPNYIPGAPVSGQGEITPGQVASGGPGKGGGSGSGKGGPGTGGDSAGGGDDDDDIHIHIDDDDDIVVDDAIDRALGYVEDGDYDLAIDEYDRLVVDEPDSVVYRKGRAGAYLHRGGYDYAIRDYDVLLAEDRVDVLTVAQRVEFFYNRGCAHLAAGTLDAAVADFTMCLKLDELGKLSYMAHNNRGISYAKQGGYDQAIADFNSAIGINAEQALAYKNRALAYRKLGKTAEAEQDMAKATDLSSL